MSLGRLLESVEGQRDTASYDTAEFFSRRLRENERTEEELKKPSQTKLRYLVNIISFQGVLPF